MHEIFSIETKERQQALDVTDAVQEIVRRSGAGEALCHVMVLHSTAALVVNETAGSPVSFSDTVDSIRTFCPNLDVQGLPWLANGNLDHAVFQYLAAKL